MVPCIFLYILSPIISVSDELVIAIDDEVGEPQTGKGRIFIFHFRFFNLRENCKTRSILIIVLEQQLQNQL